VNLQWTVLRFTWHDLVGRPDDVVAEIRATLARKE
jgi:very-short-patch-repair endonuclease